MTRHASRPWKASASWNSETTSPRPRPGGSSPTSAPRSSRSSGRNRRRAAQLAPAQGRHVHAVPDYQPQQEVRGRWIFGPRPANRPCWSSPRNRTSCWKTSGRARWRSGASAPTFSTKPTRNSSSPASPPSGRRARCPSAPALPPSPKRTEGSATLSVTRTARPSGSASPSETPSPDCTPRSAP